MKGISRRLKRENPLGEAAGLLEQLGAGLEQDFVEFFPQLRGFVEGWASEGPRRSPKN
jgi:acyl carrier protein phosphodiesterase